MIGRLVLTENKEAQEKEILDVSHIESYDKDHCWQYEIRQRNLKEDLERSGMTLEQANKLTVDDFNIKTVGPQDREEEDRKICEDINKFIQRHEWLKKMPNRPTHRFAARYEPTGELAGALVMAIPNTFSDVLGGEYKDREKLISRGACISWSPKCLGSHLIMASIKYMAQTTEFCIFTGYSDPDARELGTIYQACNFYYLGEGSGGNKMYKDPARPHLGWFGARNFRHRSKYKMYADQLIEAGENFTLEDWKSWQKKWCPDWTKVPSDIKIMIKDQERLYRESCKVREVSPKHKYCYVLGRSKKETKALRKLFEERNPGAINRPYPKERGPKKKEAEKIADVAQG